MIYIPSVKIGVKHAVDLGLLFPNKNINNPDQLPEKEGIFHLAYILAPYFRILPRRGTNRKLQSIISSEQQLKLFNDSKEDDCS